jgi:hypothetical protein
MKSWKQRSSAGVPPARPTPLTRLPDPPHLPARPTPLTYPTRQIWKATLLLQARRLRYGGILIFLQARRLRYGEIVIRRYGQSP